MTTEARSVENRTRLVAHFDGYKTREEQSAGWSNIWGLNESDLWDRGQPSPALINFLENHPYGQALLKTERPLKAFVPLISVEGCGRGHDVAMLLLHGLETWGLEVSKVAVDTANENIQAQLTDTSAQNTNKIPPQSKSGNAEVILGDFFERDWEQQLGPNFDGFDVIYDYTFLCALLPTMRKDWARRISELLSPSGILICLEFPMWKPLEAQGPPWGLKGVHYNLLANGGDGMVDASGQLNQPDEELGAFEKVLYWKPPMSFEQSRGEDMISVWKSKQGTSTTVNGLNQEDT
ncbi:Nn.00g066800.m01.CDS01 [Neocucurbitaria sp. VM-36]